MRVETISTHGSMAEPFGRRYRAAVAFFRRPLVRWTFVVLLTGQMLYGTGFATVAAAARWGWPGAAAVAAAGAAAAACCLLALAREGERRNAALLGLTLLGGLALNAAEAYSGMAFLYIAVYALPFRTGPPPAVALIVSGVAAFATASPLSGLAGWELVGNLLGLGYAAILAFLIRQLVVTRERSAEAAEARAREAVLAERTRLAREVHDILAHSQSAQIVYLEGARLLLERGRDRAAALDRVNRAAALARTSLEETRRALDALRGQELSLAERLERLAVEYRSVTGAACTVSVAGDPGPLEAEARLAVARTAQEALTNTRKHAPGAPVTVDLRLGGDWCELEVRDTGGAAGRPSPAGSGYGLVGMRERAELIGGSLTAGPSGEGFGVLLRVPVRRAGEDGAT
ncbi:sensor histidine kinase [Planobispora rosea]|nr:sensor histidine kinase [Planobispora rosea]